MHRVQGRLALAGVALVLAAVLAVAVVAAWPPTRAPHELPWIPLAVDKSLGVNADLTALDPAGQEATMVAMEAAGMRWLRVRFAWDVIEPARGKPDWTAWDAVVDAAVRHELRLIAVLDGSPAWARAPQDAANPLAPPVEARDFGDWVEALAARYGDRIDYYQIWDEPNIAPHWGTREIDPAGYLALLREGAVRVRAIDPNAVVLVAALAPNVEPGGANMSELDFLNALYERGGAAWFDVVAAQPYTFGEPVNAAADTGVLNWQRMALLRQVMEQQGDAATAVWAVSFAVGGADVPADESAAMVTAGVERARQAWPWLGPMLWAAWSPGDPHGQYALVDDGGEPGPAYPAVAALASTPPAAWPGVYPAGHASGAYEGEWRITPSLADIGASGDRLRISFEGTGIDLRVERGPYRAFLFVTVDGQPANALPRDGEGRRYAVLYDPLGGHGRVALANGLTPGAHTAEVVAERGWGQWAIAGWAVRWEEGTERGWLSPLLAVACIAFVALAAVLGWPERWVVLEAGREMVARARAVDGRVSLALVAAAALLLYVTVGTLPSLAALGLLALLLLLWPDAGLLLIAFSLPFYQLGKPLLGKVFSMTEILTLLTLAGWGLGRVAEQWAGRAEARRWHVPRLTALDWGVLALVGVGAASLLWTEHVRVAAREFRTVVLEAAIFYGLLRASVWGRRQAWRVADAWILGAAAIAIIGIGQWASGHGLIAAEGVSRVRGYYGSPNNLALYLGRALPLTLAIAAWGKGGARRLAYAGAAGVVAVALLLTYSRGAWLVGVPLALLFLGALRGRRALVFAAGALLVFALLLLVVAGPGRFTSLIDMEQGTTFFRLQLWQSSWHMARDHPLLGVGLDNFLYQYRSHYVLPTAWEEFDLSHPHNVVFDFWLRLGLPGLIVGLWMLATFFGRAWRAYRRLPAGDERLMILGLIAGMVYFVAHGLVDNAFFLVDLAFAFMLMAALVQVGLDAGPRVMAANLTGLNA